MIRRLSTALGAFVLAVIALGGAMTASASAAPEAQPRAEASWY